MLVYIVLFVFVSGAMLVCGQNPLLFWIPNRAGLFSHFLQLKRMQRLALTVGRALVVAPSKSPHYGNMTIDMCSIFDFPASVQCGSVPAHVPCTNRYDQLQWQEPHVCYSGSITLGANVRGRRFVLDAVDVPLPLLFQPDLQRVADRFREVIVERFDGKATAASPIVAVHWRRGDQLQGRCTNGVDVSVNCEDGATFINTVLDSLRDSCGPTSSTIYVATNEPQHSPEMAILREQGFISLADVSGPDGEPALRNLNPFEVLVAEVSLMLVSDIFLAWGISEINDVVERERREHKRSYCVATAQELAGGRNITPAHETWCSRQLLTQAATPHSQDKDGIRVLDRVLDSSVDDQAKLLIVSSEH